MMWLGTAEGELSACIGQDNQFKALLYSTREKNNSLQFSIP